VSGDHLVTRGVLVGLIVCIAGLVAAISLLFVQNRALEQERQDRARQDVASFLKNCRNREREIAAINKVLGLPPTGVNCMNLPVIKKGAS
jgi:hypothetical protein